MLKIFCSASSRMRSTGMPFGFNALVEISSLAVTSRRSSDRSRTISAYRRMLLALGTYCARELRYGSPPISPALPRFWRASYTVMTSAGLVAAVRVLMAAKIRRFS